MWKTSPENPRYMASINAATAAANNNAKANEGGGV